MASIDKAAIAFSIAITAIGVGIAMAGESIDVSPAATTAPPVSTMMSDEDTVQGSMMEDSMEDSMMEDAMMEDSMMDSMEDSMMEDSMEGTMMEDTMMDNETTGPMTHTVDIPIGTAVPGCEETNECYMPADITINAGDTVEWINVDTAAHTVTAGSPSEGPSGVFDSSLVMGNAAYSFTFDDAGSYDYFCLVHPWMTGSVTVN